MSHFSDHDGEMSNHQLITDQDMVEAFLSGRAAQTDELGFLTGFADDLRLALSGAVPAPRADLAVLLTTGLSGLVATEPWDAAATARLAPGQSKPGKARSLVSRVFAGAAAKIVGVAAAGVIGAGAFGVLPASAQHAVATAISAVTPLQFPDPAINHAKVGANGSGGVTGAAGHESQGQSRADGTPVGGAAPARPSGPNSGGVSTVLSRANETPAASQVPTSVPGSNAGGGSTGLSRANETPAAGQVPTSVPGSNAGGGSTGLSRAGQTPAAGHVPSSVPGSNAGGGSTGESRAGQTPAAGHTPPSVGHR